VCVCVCACVCVYTHTPGGGTGGKHGAATCVYPRTRGPIAGRLTAAVLLLRGVSLGLSVSGFV
jgi:hypothetical protein